VFDDVAIPYRAMTAARAVRCEPCPPGGSLIITSTGTELEARLVLRVLLKKSPRRLVK